MECRCQPTNLPARRLGDDGRYRCVGCDRPIGVPRDDAPLPDGAARYRSPLHPIGDVLYGHDSVIDLDLSPPGRAWTADTEYVFRPAIPDRLVKQYSLVRIYDDEGEVVATVDLGDDRFDIVRNADLCFLVVPLDLARADFNAMQDSLRQQGWVTAGSMPSPFPDPRQLTIFAVPATGDA